MNYPASRVLASTSVTVALAMSAFTSLPAKGQALQEVACCFINPMVVTSAVGDNRMFVAERSGIIRAVDKTTGASTVFLDIASKVGDTTGERGLLGLAFDPGFASNGRFYVNYSDATTGNITIERYSVSGPPGSAADANTALSLMSIPTAFAGSPHKAGWIGFRPGESNNLYIATGDGGFDPVNPDPFQNGQNTGTNLGKMLRIDVTRDDFASDAARNYGIPVGNMQGAGVNPEIWAYGLRNPFRNSFDRSTGDLWIGDVGFNSYEEVNFLRASAPGGTNFGWSLREGATGASVPGAVDPIFQLAHGSGGSAIIGGVVYRGPITALQGKYFFANFVTNSVSSFDFDGTNVTGLYDWSADWASTFGTRKPFISSFGEDNQGNVFMTDLISGRMFAITSVVPEPASWLLIGAALPLLRRLRSAQLSS